MRMPWRRRARRTADPEPYYDSLAVEHIGDPTRRVMFEVELDPADSFDVRLTVSSRHPRRWRLGTKVLCTAIYLSARTLDELCSILEDSLNQPLDREVPLYGVDGDPCTLIVTNDLAGHDVERREDPDDTTEVLVMLDVHRGTHPAHPFGGDVIQLNGYLADAAPRSR